MARNAELVRQWEILRAIDGARCGIAVTKLAAERDVHPRTIRRDIDALCRAGFPLYDEKVNGTSMWKLRAKPFRCMEQNGLGLTELAALYFGRSVLAAAGATVFETDVDRALMKIERTVPEASRQAVAQLPRILNAKRTGRKKLDDRRLRDLAARALDAIVRARRVTMRYASAASARTKEYAVDPQRISCADGGLYLIAWVAEYGQLRTFAMERIETLALTDERVERKPLPAEAFGNSLGVNSGPTEVVAIEFDAQSAAYVSDREWHRSQEIEEREDGAVVLRLEVCNDLPLERWILSFGAHARVLAPASLAQRIRQELEQARSVYLSGITLEMARMMPSAIEGTRAGSEDTKLPSRTNRYRASL
jgi:proteasome accessory factor B